MSAEADPDLESAPKKKGIMLPLIVGLVLALGGGGGGFWAVTAGPLSGLTQADSDDMMMDDDSHDMAEDSYDEYGSGRVDVAFVPLDRLTVSLGPESGNRHLIFAAQLEVDPRYLEEVSGLTPRILDVFNSYLRVVGVDELGAPTSLARLRAQMLHRVQIVAGDGRVRDLLITEFVVN